jgi:hypothetical protein
VVQLQSDADVARAHWAGRGVHVVSGQQARFATLPEPVTFITRRLADALKNPAKTGGPP